MEEDPDGITIVRDWVEDASSSGLFLALCLGRFAAADLPRPRFLARNLMRDRIGRVSTAAVGRRSNGPAWPT